MSETGGGDAPDFGRDLDRIARKRFLIDQTGSGNDLRMNPQTGGGDALGEFAKDLAAKQEPLGEPFATVLNDLVQEQQTGGGDAWERELLKRAREIATAWCLEACREAATGSIFFALRSSHREVAEAISDDMNAAHWHGYREGWIAGREEAANLARNHADRDRTYDLPAAIRSLAIPGSKTDAG
jgi:hypothetical protein